MLFSQVRGTGQPVLLLHSGGMSSRQWNKLAEALAPTHRVIAPDFLGSGQNPPWPEGRAFEFGDDVDEVAAILQDLGEPAHVVGHSYGGLVAITLARRHPTAVRSLVAYDPVAMGVLRSENDAEGLRSLAAIGDCPLFNDDAQGGNAAWFEIFVDWWNGPGTWTKMAPQARDAFLQVGRKVFYEVRSLMHDATPASAYANVVAPTLFLTGERTPVAAQRVVAQLARALPCAHCTSISGAGHMGPVTHARLVNDAIVRHIVAAS